MKTWNQIRHHFDLNLDSEGNEENLKQCQRLVFSLVFLLLWNALMSSGTRWTWNMTSLPSNTMQPVWLEEHLIGEREGAEPLSQTWHKVGNKREKQFSFTCSHQLLIRERQSLVSTGSHDLRRPLMSPLHLGTGTATWDQGRWTSLIHPEEPLKLY